MNSLICVARDAKDFLVDTREYRDIKEYGGEREAQDIFEDAIKDLIQREKGAKLAKKREFAKQFELLVKTFPLTIEITWQDVCT